MAAQLRLGTQSWTYFPDWVGPFYPPGTSSAESLAFYAQVFDSVEVNTTFHAIPRASTVHGWTQRVPPDFVFALKFPRAITHEARLDPEQSGPLVDAFLEAATVLEGRLGPLLVQLPPSFHRTAENRRLLGLLFDRLPTHEQQFVVELRHESWVDEAVERTLAERNVAWCLAEGNANVRAVMWTADFAYVRWNRSGLDFPDFTRIRVDRSADLDWWAATLLSAPPRVRTIYGYMSDEFAGHAPASLRMLQERLGIEPTHPESLWPQQRLL